MHLRKSYPFLAVPVNSFQRMHVPLVWLSYRFLGNTLSVFLFTLQGCTCTQTGVSIDILKTHYPVMHYVGPKKPPKVSFQKNQPTDWTPLSQISKAALAAVLVSEDSAFYQHPGLDTKQIKEAIEKDIGRGRLSHGGSTITQQLVKNVFLTRQKSLSRKIKEAFIALKLEKMISKSKILEIYFNIVEWGPGFYGIANASQYYFKKTPSQLSPKEGAFLAMLLPNPVKYSQSFKNKALTQYASKTVRNLLDKLAQTKAITPEERDFEKIKKLSFEVQQNAPAIPGAEPLGDEEGHEEIDEEDLEIESAEPPTQ